MERPMSRGLGKSQQEIKRILQRAMDAKIGMLTFASIRAVFIMNAWGNPETDKLNPTFERSLKRSLKNLVDRGDVVFVGGGGQLDPFRYTTVEAFVDEPNTDDAKRAFVEMVAVSETALARLSSRRP